jgi:hypothetical protein
VKKQLQVWVSIIFPAFAQVPSGGDEVGVVGVSVCEIGILQSLVPKPAAAPILHSHPDLPTFRVFAVEQLTRFVSGLPKVPSFVVGKE